MDAPDPETPATPGTPEDSGAPARDGAPPQLWVSTTYFAEGFPYSVVNNLPEILFKELGASLQSIGLTSLFHLPWNLKFLWGPLLDRYETKRRWLLAMEVVLAVALVVLAFLATSIQLLGAISVVLLVMAVLSATHDIAIDGYYLEALDEDGQSRFVGHRAMAYKVASLVVTGPLVVLIGRVGWTLGLLATAGIMGLILAVHLWTLPRPEVRQRPVRKLLAKVLGLEVLLFGIAIALLVTAERRVRVVTPRWEAFRAWIGSLPYVGSLSLSSWIVLIMFLAMVVGVAALPALRRRIHESRSDYARAFVDFLDQPRVGFILAFVVLFRTGESFLMKMKWPFLKDGVHLTLESYGVINGTFGVLFSFLGTFLGGYLISRGGLKRWIWPFVIAQNLLNLLYMGLALAPPAPGTSGWGPAAVVICAEQFGAGLGTAVFMVYLMRCCDPRHKAAHMAILTALMSISFTLAGVLSGVLADAMGFASYFGFTFLATIPGMLLIPFIPRLEDPSANAGA